MTRNVTPVAASEASVATIAVSIHAVRIGSKQMTLAVFGQLPEGFPKEGDTHWGYVRRDDDRHLLFVHEGILYRASERSLKTQVDDINRMKQFTHRDFCLATWLARPPKTKDELPKWVEDTLSLQRRRIDFDYLNLILLIEPAFVPEKYWGEIRTAVERKKHAERLVELEKKRLNAIRILTDMDPESTVDQIAQRMDQLMAADDVLILRYKTILDQIDTMRQLFVAV